jgi:hypothetical protein
LVDGVFDLPASHRRRRHELELNSAIPQLNRRLDKDGLPLLLHDPANIHQPGPQSVSDSSRDPGTSG